MQLVYVVATESEQTKWKSLVEKSVAWGISIYQI
jgi:hypothetical protein